MFNFLKKSKQNGLSDAKRMKMIRELSGLAIRYSTERADNTDNVVGKGGSLILRDDTFFVYSDAGTVFSCLSSELDVSFLMSGDGAILTGPDRSHGDVIRSVTVHFTYYRK